MGDQADWDIEDQLDSLILHNSGQCISYCRYCMEEEEDELKKSIKSVTQPKSTKSKSRRKK